MENINELQHWGIKGMRWGVRRYQNKDGSLTPAGEKRYANNHEDYNKAHDDKSVSSMSDAELKARNNRLQMEKQYRELTNKKSVGKNIVIGFIKTAGTITAIMYAYMVYKDIGHGALDKIGDFVVKGINLSGKQTD